MKKIDLKTKTISELNTIRAEVNGCWYNISPKDRKKIKDEISKQLKYVPVSERKSWEKILYK